MKHLRPQKWNEDNDLDRETETRRLAAMWWKTTEVAGYDVGKKRKMKSVSAMGCRATSICNSAAMDRCCKNDSNRGEDDAVVGRTKRSKRKTAKWNEPADRTWVKAERTEKAVARLICAGAKWPLISEVMTVEDVGNASGRQKIKDRSKQKKADFDFRLLYFESE